MPLIKRFCVTLLFIKFPDSFWVFPKTEQNGKSFLLEENFVLIPLGTFSLIKDEPILIFLGKSFRLNWCRRELPFVFVILPFDLLAVCFVVFFCHLCCCCVWKCWREDFCYGFQHFLLLIVSFLLEILIKRVYFLLPISLNINKISLWTLVLSSTCFQNWQPNSSVLFLDNNGAKILNIPLASDFEFNEIFKTFKHWKYATLLFAWPSNISQSV